MVNFNSIAIFVLATTKMNIGGQYQDYKTFYKSRIVPIANTWGSMFPHFYFVLGTNKFDYKHLQNRCLLQNEGRRYLAPHTPQTPSRDTMERYLCPLNTDERMIHANFTSANTLNNPGTSLLSKAESYNVLFTANCTGEYFGMGPTCRCQEAMRYFKNEPSLREAEWFLFLDDDVYIRPHSLVSMIEELTNADGTAVHQIKFDEPLALVAPARLRNFDYSKKKWKKETTVDCAIPDVHEFLLAQPALLNRLAITTLSSAIEANGLPLLQLTWGGSHDILLGVLLWIYNIPTYSLQYSYEGKDLLMDPSRSILEFPEPDKRYIVHCVRNHLVYKQSKIGKTNTFELIGAIPSQYNVAYVLGDLALYSVNRTSLEETTKLIEKQKLIGKQGYAHLTRGSLDSTPVPGHALPSGIVRTLFKPYALNIVNEFKLFTPQYCPLL